jgi:solute carrier family 25 S-adenosylmethionine transporter 26
MKSKNINEELLNIFKINLIAGGLARGITIFKLHPIDTIKTNIQENKKYNFKLNKLYNGINIALIGQIPYYMLVFGSYEYIKKNLLLKYNNKIGVYITSALIADFIGALWLSPNELIKQKSQSGIINNPYNGLNYIYKYEGIRGLYRGFSILLSRDIPYRVIKLPLYEITRDYYIPKNRNIQIHESLLIASSIGMFSAALTNPQDYLKTKIMVSKEHKINIKKTIKNIIDKEGYKAFLTGIKYRTLYTGLSNGIFFSYYEFIRNNDFILNNFYLK